MDLNKISVMGMLQNKMRYSAARQNVISQNVANADVPGYGRRDISQPDFSNMVKSSMLQLSTTNSGHIQGNKTSILPTSNTGEEVELDMEAIELMKNSSEFSKASTTYKKMIALMKEAVDGGGNR